MEAKRQLVATTKPDIELGDFKHAAGPPLVAPGALDTIKLAMRVAQFARSNAVVMAHNQASLAIGAGQTSRLEAARIAASRCPHPPAGSVAASDGFFPFTDGIEVLAKIGVKIIAQPEGGKNLDQIVEFAHKISLWLGARQISLWLGTHLTTQPATQPLATDLPRP